jgi:hypothetical protein
VEQQFLVIDCSVTPARVAVVVVREDRATVIESFDHALLSPRVVESDAGSDNDLDDQQYVSQTIFDQTLFESLRDRLTLSWEQLLVIAPPEDTLFLYLSLPFRDRKTAQRVLPLEAQDLVPFDLSEFHLDYAIRPNEEDGGDVRAGFISKRILTELLQACRPAGFEPSLIVPPSSALCGLLALIPGLDSEAVAFLYGEAEVYSLLVCIDGFPWYERIISRTTTANSLMSEILMSLRSRDASSRKVLSHLFIVGEVPEAADLGSLLSIEITKVTTEPAASLCQLGAVLLADTYRSPHPTNFRSGAFAYSPLLKEVVRGGKALIPVALQALVVAGSVLLGTFLVRMMSLSNLEATLRDQITSTIPGMTALPGEELSTLKNQIQNLQAQLQDLDSPSERSALDILTDIAKYVPLSSDVSIRKVSIKGDRVVIEGTAPDYSAVDKIEKGLRRRKQLFCRLRREQASSGGAVSQRGFLFDLRICS